MKQQVYKKSSAYQKIKLREKALLMEKEQIIDLLITELETKDAYRIQLNQYEKHIGRLIEDVDQKTFVCLITSQKLLKNMNFFNLRYLLDCNQ